MVTPHDELIYSTKSAQLIDYIRNCKKNFVLQAYWNVMFKYANEALPK